MDRVESFRFFLGQVLQPHGAHGKAGGLDTRQDLSRFLTGHGIWLDDRKRSFHMSCRQSHL
jgi:hypothetical protein